MSNTLLSEYQIREYGLVIDSVAKKHKASYGKQGTQCFQVSQHVYIDFEDRGGLMGFQLLPVEDGDEQKYDVFTITSPAEWRPHNFVKETTSDNYFYDPADASNDIPNYPALVNHIIKDITAPETNYISILSVPTNPFIDIQVLATTTWHRVIHHNIDP